MQWRKPEPKNFYWAAFEATPWVETWCREHQDAVLYGEAFGMQDLKYGSKPGQVLFRAFDILRGNEFESALTFLTLLDESQRVPLVYRGPYDAKQVEALADANSTIASHLGEGVVIKPAEERTSLEIGRVALKCVSNRYLERAP